MDENPKIIMIAKLEVVVMPNGEVICAGKTLGFVKDIGKYISDAKPGA